MLEMFIVYKKEEYHTEVDRFKSVALKYGYRKLYAVQNSDKYERRLTTAHYNHSYYTVQ